MIKNFNEDPSMNSITDSESRTPMVADDCHKHLSLGQIERARAEDRGESQGPMVPDDAHFHLSVGQIARGRVQAERERYD